MSCDVSAGDGDVAALGCTAIFILTSTTADTDSRAIKRESPDYTAGDADIAAGVRGSGTDSGTKATGHSMDDTTLDVDVAGGKFQMV